MVSQRAQKVNTLAESAESAEIINNQLGDDKFKCEINQRISELSALSASKLI